MRLRSIWILLAVGLAGFALAASGCGGKSASSTTTTEETMAADTSESAMTTSDETMTEATDTAMTDTAMTETAMTETAMTETQASGTDTTGAPDLSFITSDNCREFVQLASSFATALSGSGGTDTEQAAQAMQAFADQAPDEIKDDFQTLADAYTKIADALKGVDLSSGQAPSADVIQKLQQLSSAIDSAKVTAASANISAWVTQNCTGVNGG